jgi:ankyrin repeat protein
MSNNIEHAENGKDGDGNTPLHLALLNNAPVELITILVTETNKNMKNKNGSTPLHLAILNNKSLDIITHLMNNTHK